MSKKELLDLTVFDDQRKSEMVYKKPDLVRRSQPSTYEKQPTALPTNQLSKNYFTSAPDYENRQLSEIELDNPTTFNYIYGFFLTLVWAASDAQVLWLIYHMSGGIVSICLSITFMKAIGTSICYIMLRQRHRWSTEINFKKSIQAFVLTMSSILLLVALCHRASMLSCSVLINCEPFIVALWLGHRALIYGIALLIPLFTMDTLSIILGMSLIVIKILRHNLKFSKFQLLISEIASFVMFFLIILCSDLNLHYDAWSLLGLITIPINTLMFSRLMPIINKNYIRQEGALSIIRGSMLFLLPLNLHEPPISIILWLLCTAAQTVCEYKINEEDNGDNY